MPRLITATVLILLLVGRVRADLDFTPTPREFVNEGFKYRQLLFQDSQNEKQVKYIVPDGWSWRGTATLLVLTPPDKAQAEANVERASLSVPRPLDEACVKELAQRALQSVPVESQNATIIQQQENPVIIDGNPTVEFVLSYEAYGEAFRKSLLFLHVPDSEFVFKLTARNADFEALHNVFCRSLSSWQWF